MEYFTGRKQNLKMESSGTSHSCKHKELCSETCFAPLKKRHQVSVAVKAGGLCSAARKKPFDHCSATGGVQSLVRLLRAGIERCLKKRKRKVKVTGLCQDIRHLNIQQ